MREKIQIFLNFSDFRGTKYSNTRLKRNNMSIKNSLKIGFGAIIICILQKFHQSHTPVHPTVSHMFLGKKQFMD